MSNDHEATIREYFPRMDAGDIEWVVNLFSADARYDRGDVTFTGKPAIAEFYRHGRKLKVRHVGLQFWSSGDTVFVEGGYEGVGGDGTKRQGLFADRWTFDAHGKVVVRRSSFFIGSAKD